MITKSSLSIAEAIAVAVNTDTPVHAKPLVAGLNEVSYSSVQYDDNFRSELLAVTSEDPTHTAVLDATSTKVAEAVRDALDSIGVYGVAFGKSIADAVGLSYTRKSLQMLSYSLLEHKFINVDDPFFDSPIFPTEVKNKAFDFKSIKLDALKRLEFNYPGNKEILDYVNSEHPDVKEILNDTEYELTAASALLLDLGEIQNAFTYLADGSVDFTKVKSLEINRLMKAYVIATKMYVSDEPAPWVVKGNLGDYREHVNMMFNGLTHYLINLKEVVGFYKARPVTISELNQVMLANHTVAEYAESKFLKGKVVVYYTDKALETGVSLSELVLAYFWAKLNNKPVGSDVLLTKPDEVKRLAEGYYESIDLQLKARAKASFVALANTAGVKFIMERELVLDRCKDLMPEGALVAEWLRDKLCDEYERAYHSVCDSVDTDRPEQANQPSPMLTGILASTLVPSFLRVIGCNMAASIVSHTYVNKEVALTPQEQREALHEALIKVLVGYSI